VGFAPPFWEITKFWWGKPYHTYYCFVGGKLFKALKALINIAQGEALGDIKPQLLDL